ncbi:MAG: hypothetical protein R3B84_08555 [Zavarzinella sp.]
MNTWMMEIVKDSNERIFADADLQQMMSYYQTLPNRLRLIDEMERAESNLPASIWKKIQGNTEAWVTKDTVKDLVISLRHLGLTILANDRGIVQHRWIGHLNRTLELHQLSKSVIIDIYRLIEEEVSQNLTENLRDLFHDAMSDMIDQLTKPEVNTIHQEVLVGSES